jgi:hypothetical protein
MYVFSHVAIIPVLSQLYNFMGNNKVLAGGDKKHDYEV